MSSHILDEPEQIEGFRRMTIAHGLRGEIESQEVWGVPTMFPSGGRALAAAKRDLANAGIKPERTRKQVLQQIEELWPEVKKST